MRQQAAEHAGAPRPAHDNPWDEGAVSAGGRLGSLYDLTGDEQVARTSDWARRLRDGRDGPAPDAPLSYWSPESLFEASRRMTREEGPGPAGGNAWVARQHLAVLDLREGATSADIGHAYRQLAKRHHPDRHLAADDATREFHATEMRRVIDAYRALRQLSPA